MKPAKPALLVMAAILIATLSLAGSALAKKDFSSWAMDKLISMGCVGIEFTMYEARDAYQAQVINTLPFLDLGILDVEEGDKVALVNWEPSRDRYRLVVWRGARDNSEDYVTIGRDGKKKDSGFSIKFD